MTWHKFIAMGGYAVYVWSSYAVFLVVMIGNIVVPWRARRRTWRRVRQFLADDGRDDA